MQSEKTLQFIEKAINVHGDKYGYSLVEYIKNNVKVKIICPEHGIFEQVPSNHLQGSICKRCSLKKISDNMLSNSNDFINKANIRHGDKYDYSESLYIHSKNKIKIRCRIHNYMFEQTPNNHLKGAGCSKCKNDKTSDRCLFDISSIINKMSGIHGNKYDYSFINYKGTGSKIKIRCRIHNYIFEQLVSGHLSGKEGCPKCRKLITSNEEFITKSKEIHGNRYDYSLVEHIKARDKVKIICSEHGEFSQQASSHLNGNGCPKCGYLSMVSKTRLTTEEFVCKSQDVHGDKYGYNLTTYKRGIDKVKIICKEHGVFEQKANGHLNGKGCRKCSLSKGEIRLYNFLRFYFSIINSYKSKTYLKQQHLDIYITQHNIGIEYQGKQHFKPIDFFGGEKGFENHCNADQRKREACEKHGIKLFYFSYDLSYVPNDYPYKVYSDEQELLEAINNYIEVQKEKLAS